MAVEDAYKEGLAALHALDYERAYQLLLPFAQQGHAEAQCCIGNVYELGRSDVTAAISWYLRSSEQGYGVASSNLGSIFLSGRDGNPPDKVKAKQWYDKARAQGFPHSPLIDLET